MSHLAVFEVLHDVAYLCGSVKAANWLSRGSHQPCTVGGSPHSLFVITVLEYNNHAGQSCCVTAVCEPKQSPVAQKPLSVHLQQQVCMMTRSATMEPKSCRGTCRVYLIEHCMLTGIQ